MTSQTKDNWRCLAAALFAIVAGAALFGSFPGLLEVWWSWIPLLAVPALATYVFNSRRPAQRDRVCFDDTAITHTRPDGAIETVRWDQLQEVGILTTDEGPFAEDVYWMFLATGGGCAITGGAVGMEELLARLGDLPGFDNEAVIKAMGSTADAKFVCWRKNRGNERLSTQ